MLPPFAEGVDLLDLDEGMSSSKTIAITDSDRTLLSVLSMSVFFVGASEFMLSTMLNPLSVAFGADSVGIAWLISIYAFA